MESNKKLVSIIIVLTILVIGLGGFIVYDKVLSKSETKEQEKANNTEEQFTSIAVDDQRVLNTLFIIDNRVSRNAYDYTKAEVKTITANDISPEYKKAVAAEMDSLKSNGWYKDCDSYKKYDHDGFFCGTESEGPDMQVTMYYTEDTLKKSVEKYFGKGSYVSGRFKTSLIENHEFVNGEYIIQTAGAGDMAFPLVYKVKDAKVSDTTLIYNVSVDSECSSMGSQEMCTKNYDYNYEFTFKKDSEDIFRFEKLVKTLNK